MEISVAGIQTPPVGKEWWEFQNKNTKEINLFSKQFFFFDLFLF